MDLLYRKKGLLSNFDISRRVGATLAVAKGLYMEKGDRKGRPYAICLRGYSSAMASISQRTFLGRVFTAQQLRAGLPVKYFA